MNAFGLGDLFSIYGDFSGIYNQTGSFLKNIIQKAFINVDEKGTEAAAATAAIMVSSTPDVILKIDHPFIYILYDKLTSTILFIGRLVEM